MKKKIMLLLSICLLAFSITACTAKDQSGEVFNGVSYEDFKSFSENVGGTIGELSEEDKEGIMSQDTSGLWKGVFENYEANQDEIGEFKEFGSFVVSKSGKTYVTDLKVKCSKRDFVLTCAYKAHNMELESIAINPVYSLGEKLGKAGLNTIIGISIVFLVLLLMSFIIAQFKHINAFANRNTKKDEVEVEKKNFVEQIAQREEVQDDYELIAVITAAVAMESNMPKDGFVVRSIKRR